MKQELDKFYSGVFGLIGGSISFINNIDENLITLLFRTMIVASISTLTGLLVREIYFKIKKDYLSYKEKYKSK